MFATWPSSLWLIRQLTGAKAPPSPTLTGTEALSFAQTAQVLARELGKVIHYRPTSIADYFFHLRRRQMPRGQILVKTLLHIGLRFGIARFSAHFQTLTSVELGTEWTTRKGARNAASAFSLDRHSHSQSNGIFGCARRLEMTNVRYPLVLDNWRAVRLHLRIGNIG